MCKRVCSGVSNPISEARSNIICQKIDQGSPEEGLNPIRVSSSHRPLPPPAAPMQVRFIKYTTESGFKRKDSRGPLCRFYSFAGAAQRTKSSNNSHTQLTHSCRVPLPTAHVRSFP